MKYTIKENKDGTHTLLRYGDLATRQRPNNAELEFWFRIQELEAEVKKLKATQKKRETISCEPEQMESFSIDPESYF
jgi:hypothetical protein